MLASSAVSEAEAPKSPTYHAICWEGDWTNLPQTCAGVPEVWDQTIGCPVCGMNIWFLPKRGQWPAWAAASEPPEGWWRDRGANPYDPYVGLFEQIHAAAKNAVIDDDDDRWQGP